MRGRRGGKTALAGVVTAVMVVVARTASADASPTPPPATVVAGIAFGHLPAGLGTSSDFAYRYQGVQFAARVWESAAPTGGWRVDLDVDVMRGARLTDGAALHDWFVAYEARPPAEARYLAVRVHGHPGWLSTGQVFWLQRRGFAVSVSLDRARWPVPAVVETGWSAYEAPS